MQVNCEMKRLHITFSVYLRKCSQEDKMSDFLDTYKSPNLPNLINGLYFEIALRLM